VANLTQCLDNWKKTFFLAVDVPVPPRRKIERGMALKNKRGTEAKRSGMNLNTFKENKAAVGPAITGFREIMVEYRTKKPEPGMDDISEEEGWPESELSKRSREAREESNTRLDAMATANTSFTTGDATEDADMSAKLAGINMNEGEK
jgi:hypothetical protein